VTGREPPSPPPSVVLTYGVDITPEDVARLTPSAVTGSRTFPNPALVERWVQLRRRPIIVGDASGVDTVVRSVAEQARGYTLIVVPFRTNAGRIGGLLRNPDVVRHAVDVAAFWDALPGDRIGSTGTAHAALWALVYGKPRTIYLPDGTYHHVQRTASGGGMVIPDPPGWREPLRPDTVAEDGSRNRLGPLAPRKAAALPFT
jgi:hypothetical protein